MYSIVNYYASFCLILLGAKTVIRTVYGNSKGFGVKVGMHQGSGLSLSYS